MLRIKFSRKGGTSRDGRQFSASLPGRQAGKSPTSCSLNVIKHYKKHMRYPLVIQFFLLVILTSCSNSKSEQSKEGDSSPSNFTLIKDVVYGHDFGMALTLDVYVPTKPNGAGIILTNSGGWTSPFDIFKVLEEGHYRFATDQEMTE